MAVIAPTRRLLFHLQTTLAESCPGLLNVHFFHHDALARAAMAAGGGRVPRVMSDGAKEAFLARLIEEAGGDLAAYAAARPGSVSALAATMNDLREAGADATVARGLPGLSPGGAELMRLYAAYTRRLDGLERRGMTDRAGVLRSALPAVRDFASRFRLVVHYGAYELIGANLDLMKGIETSAARLVYLVPFHPTARAFDHARRFWPEMLGSSPVPIDGPPGDRRILGDRLPLLYDEDTAPPALAPPAVSLFHAQGDAAELREVARRILALHQERGLPLRRVAVIARTLEPYAPLLRTIFTEHGLPFTTSATLGALREARVQAALHLASAVLGDFERQPLMDLCRSGLLVLDGKDPSSEAHAWDRLGREWEVARGFEAWTRDLPGWLEAWEPHLPDDADDLLRARAATLKETRLRQARALAAAVRILARAAAPVRAAGGWGAWGSALEAALRAHVDGFQEDEGDGALDAGAPPGLEPGALLVLGALHDMRDLDEAALPFTAAGAHAWFERLLAAATVPVGSADNGGVRILDAMQARGTSYDAVYLIGFNADLFPRRSREDPFLGEADRRLLRQRLAVPLPLQSAARDEEHLLLAHLLGSARRRLTVSWQRADEAGRARVPSLALREVARVALGAAGLERAETSALRVSTHPRDAGREALERFGFLPAAEARLSAALQLRSPRRLLEALPRLPPSRTEEDPEALGAGLRMLSVIEDFSAGDLRYDAFVGDALAPSGPWSPSRLETLGACAQHYFFRHVLRVEEMADPGEEHEIDRADLGLSVHRILHDVYRALQDSGDLRGASVEVAAVVGRAEELTRRAWERNTSRLAARLRPRYPLLWETTSAVWLEALSRFLRADLAALLGSGARLIGLEQEAAATLAPDASGRRVAIHGRFDRILREDQGDVVVSDYKTSGRLEEHVRMANLLKGTRLQMPLYLFMAEALLETWSAGGAKVRVEVLGVGPAFDPGSPPGEDDPGRADLDAEKFRAHREGLQETIAVLFDLAASGSFPFNPASRLCRHCPYLRACRKTHTPTLTRLEAAPGASTYALLRGKSTRAPRLADVRVVAGEEEA